MAVDPVARKGLVALAKGKPRVVTGALNNVLIFVGTRLSPRWLVQSVARRLMIRRPAAQARGVAPGVGAQPFMARSMWSMTSQCSFCGLNRMTSASLTTRTVWPGGQ